MFYCTHFLCQPFIDDIMTTLRERYPQLTINYVTTLNGSAWAVIHRQGMVLYSSTDPPTYDPHLVLKLADGNITFDFRAFSQSIDSGPFSWQTIEEYLNTLLPNSSYALCPGKNIISNCNSCEHSYRYQGISSSTSFSIKALCTYYCSIRASSE